MKKENAFVKDLIKKMTLDQKIGALLTLGFAGTVPRRHIYDYITKYHCGGLRLSPAMRTFGSYVDPKSSKEVVSVTTKRGIKFNNPPSCTASEYKAVLDDLQRVARERPLSIPLHFSFAQYHFLKLKAFQVYHDQFLQCFSQHQQNYFSWFQKYFEASHQR